MKNTPISCVILAAGKGTRMCSDLPKVMHPIAGRPMIAQVAETAAALKPKQLIVVLAPGMAQLADCVSGVHAKARIVEQAEQLGTGHAVRQAESALAGASGIVLVLYGDTPLLSSDTLRDLVAHVQQSGAAIGVLGMRAADATAAYGRLVLQVNGDLDAIVEYKDASEEQRRLPLSNSGVMAIDATRLMPWLARLTNQNANGEYYLTDIVALARADGAKCIVVEADEAELQGVNTRVQLAEVESVMQERLRESAMLAGATMLDPGSVTMAWDTALSKDVVVEPNVFFAPGVKIGERCHIRAFSYLESCRVDEEVVIGPYARIRPETHIEAEARIGNFVELKKATVARGAKINHLSYVGDAHVGVYANIGAGTITCNYDGFQKHRSVIGDHVFVGSNTALIAPVLIGQGAIIGAGSIITEDVEADSLSLTRSAQQHRQGWAKRFRLKKRN